MFVIQAVWKVRAGSKFRWFEGKNQVQNGSKFGFVKFDLTLLLNNPHYMRIPSKVMSEIAS